MSSPRQLNIKFTQSNVSYDVSLIRDKKSEYSVKINGISYAVLGDKEKLKTACEILNSVPLNSITNNEDLKGRLAVLGNISFPVQKVDDVGISALNQPLLPSLRKSDSIGNRSAWLVESDGAAEVTKRQVAEKYWAMHGSKEDHSGILGFLKGRLIEEDQVHLVRELEDALKNQKKEKFTALFEQIPMAFVDGIEGGENLQILPMRTILANREITEADKHNLEDYMHDSGFSGVVSLSFPKGQLAVKTSSISDLEKPLSMHSIGKVFTGMLLMSLMQKGMITTDMIDKPIILEAHVIKQLEEKGIPKEALDKITLRQVMQHTSGLGDYLGNYQNAIKMTLAEGLLPPEIERPEDLLQFADSSIKTLQDGEESYSNLGSLLFGLSLQYHYNKKLNDQIQSVESHIVRLTNLRDRTDSLETKESLNKQIEAQQKYLQRLNSSYTPYSEMLKKEIVQPAKLDSFSEKRPANAHYDEKDPNAYGYGAPAGGYWITAKDLDKFGQWVCKKFNAENPHQETSLHQLLEKYGSEFYRDGVIEHNGATPSGSGHFTTFLTHGVTVAILSDQSRLRGNFAADDLYYAIHQNLITVEEISKK